MLKIIIFENNGLSLFKFNLIEHISLTKISQIFQFLPSLRIQKCGKKKFV